MTAIHRLRAFPADSRAETGPMQFGKDWPGVFIRGDDALGYSVLLKRLIQAVTPALAERLSEKSINFNRLGELAELLASCRSQRR